MGSTLKSAPPRTNNNFRDNTVWIMTFETIPFEISCSFDTSTCVQYSRRCFAFLRKRPAAETACPEMRRMSREVWRAVASILNRAGARNKQLNYSGLDVNSLRSESAKRMLWLQRELRAWRCKTNRNRGDRSSVENIVTGFRDRLRLRIVSCCLVCWNHVLAQGL